ncbi:MAG: autotransporter-associated beta strand repeat-containing protein [Verrucomicrobia bacterium]|nr:autotransporter-associated beta strand repeat-containing protein [Verrucomicrobiota bacterium]
MILESSGDPQVAKINFHDVHFGILQINHSNTYSGGTQIHGGKINVRKSDGLGTGPISIHAFGTLSTDTPLPNPLTILQGTLFHCSLTGPVTLKGTAHLISNCTLAGDLSGPGGLTHLGTNGTYLSMIPGGTLTLEGTNSYTGSTIIFPGTLIVKKAASLYRGDPTQWTTGHITIHQAATLHLFIGGAGEFTGPQVGSLLGNLTTNPDGWRNFNPQYHHPGRNHPHLHPHRRQPRPRRRPFPHQKIWPRFPRTFRQKYLHRSDHSPKWRPPRFLAE